MSERELKFCLVSRRRRKKITKQIKNYLSVIKYFESKQEPIPEHINRSIQNGMKRSRWNSIQELIVEIQNYLEEIGLD